MTIIASEEGVLEKIKSDNLEAKQKGLKTKEEVTAKILALKKQELNQLAAKVSSQIKALKDEYSMIQNEISTIANAVAVGKADKVIILEGNDLPSAGATYDQTAQQNLVDRINEIFNALNSMNLIS